MHLNKDRATRLSRFLSMVLRHKPETIDLTLDKNGWANVRELITQMNKHGKTINKEILEFIVANNDKQRFCFNDDKTLIRANQGHSLDIDLGYQVKSTDEVPTALYHGTAESFAKKILACGSIEKMQRHHVHLSADITTANKVGQRHGKLGNGKLVIFAIDTHAMIADGYQFYQSDNDVWLTDSVPVKYISKI